MSIATDPDIPVTDGAAGTDAVGSAPTEPLPQPERPRDGINLGTQFFLSAAALIVVTLGLTIAFATWKARSVAEERIRAALEPVPDIYEGYRDSQMAARRRQVHSLAEQPGTKALLAEVEAGPATFHDSARDFAKTLGANAVLLFDAKGGLLSRSDRDVDTDVGLDFSRVSWVRTPLAERGEASAYIFEIEPEKILSLVAAAPVVQGAGSESKINGVIAASFNIDHERARELGRLTSAEVAFLGNVAPRGAAPRLEVLCSTASLSRLQLARLLSGYADSLETLLGRGKPYGPFELSGAGASYIGAALPILSGSGEPIAALIVARSKDAEMAAFARIRNSLLLTAGVMLVLAVPASFALAHRLSRPLRQLASSAVQIGTGQLDVSLPQSGGGEVGALARAFTGMVAELRAKAELEKLVAEMQRRPGDITLAGAAPAESPSEEPAGLGVGHLFGGRYEILSTLGEGGMGTVFRARDRELDEDVALKVLKPDPDAPAGGDASLDARTASDTARLEIKLARMITHPNVVRVHDFGTAQGARFITMEYVPGTTLRELLDGRRGLEPTPALQIAKQLCRGLAAVHKVGVVHGDLKPQNVMVMGNGVAKLMDFGVARIARYRGSSGYVLGTPLYLSPEQARGAELDERSDIYSAGVVMFEMFTGLCPFVANDIAEIMRMHTDDPPPNPRNLRPAIPQSLSQIILSCLAKSRLQRPANATELDRLLMSVRL